MKYSVPCSCGQVLPVEATQAGSTLVCRCQQSVKVPRLSALRVAAGESAMPLNAAERVRHLVQQGLLPSNDLCPLTHKVPNAIAVFRVHCERSWTKSSGSNMTHVIIGALLLGWLGALIAFSRGKRQHEQFGRDTFVDLPLRVSSEALLEFSRGQHSQNSLRKLLSCTPEYEAVFREYSGAVIKFESGTN